jgi:hypothetical protein
MFDARPERAPPPLGQGCDHLEDQRAKRWIRLSDRLIRYNHHYELAKCLVNVTMLAGQRRLA